MTDSEVIAKLKLQLELEKIKAMRSEADAKMVEMELLMQRERVTLSTDQSSDQAARSDDNGEKADVRHLLPRMSDAVDFDCLSFFHSLEVTFKVYVTETSSGYALVTCTKVLRQPQTR